MDNTGKLDLELEVREWQALANFLWEQSRRKVMADRRELLLKLREGILVGPLGLPDEADRKSVV